MGITWWSYYILVVPKPPIFNSFYSVNLVLVKHGFLLVRYCLTKSMLMLMFVSYLRKHALH
jgi:hypothetical protein